MKLEDVKLIGVVGAGIMGGGITQTAILAGFNVVTRDLNEEILARTKETIINGRFGLKSTMERGKITQQQMDAAVARMTLTTKVTDLANCDYVIEAIGGGPSDKFENKDMKFKVFAELDKVVKKGAVIASNTSRFTIADLAGVCEPQRRPNFIGMHWFSPANIMKAVEVIWTKENPEENIKLVEDMCLKFGKNPVRVKDVPGDTGFVGNRIFSATSKEARKIMEEGICSAEGIDAIMMGGFNWPAGPIGMIGGAKAGFKK